MIDFNTFKKTLDKFDSYFNGCVENFSSLKNQFDKFKKEQKESLDYCVQESIDGFSNALEKLKGKISGYKNYFESEPVKFLFNIQAIKDATYDIGEKINESSFGAFFDNFFADVELIEKQYNLFSQIKFDESKLNSNYKDSVISGIKNKDIRSFSQIDYTKCVDDNDLRKLGQDIYKNINTILKKIEMLIDFIRSNEYKKMLSKQLANEDNRQKEIIENLYNDKKTEADNDLLSFYEKECVPFLNDNKKCLESDFHTPETVDLPLSFDNDFNVGSISYSLKGFENYKTLVEPIDREKLLSKKIEYPVYIDLKQKGNILINTDANDPKVVEFVHQLIMQFILTCPTRKMNLSLIDIDSDSEYDLVMNYFKEYLDSNHLLFPKGIVTEQEHIKDVVAELSKKFTEIKGNRLSRSNTDNIFDYNASNPDNTQEAYLMVYINYPKNMDPAQTDKFVSLIKNGPKCGIYSIIVNNTTVPVNKEAYGYHKDMHKEIISAISEVSEIFDYTKESKQITYKNTVFTPNGCLQSKDINGFFSKLLEIDNDKSRVKTFFLDELLATEYTRPNYYDVLKIPVGKNSEGPVFFELEVGGTGSSCVIGGGTGSGKTSFLHTLVLSGSYFYSPDELEFYLIDFKDGVEFSNYADRENGINVPHVSYLSLQNRVEDAYDLLLKLYKEKERRNKLFVQAGVSDIRGYMESSAVKSKKLHPLKRLVVIIDEYQNFIESKDSPILANKCNDLLTKLLKEIRSCGISLVLSSQDISLDQECKNQIQNKYMFKATPIALAAAFPGANTEEMAKQLQTEVGLGYKTKDINGERNTLFKFGWSGETNKSHQRDLAATICEKWSEYPYEKPIISGNQEPLMFKDGVADFITFSPVDEENEDYIETVVGQSPLSNLPLTINFTNIEFSSYIILGNIKKSRNIEASIGLSFLYSLYDQEFDAVEKNLIYVDLSIANDALKYRSIFETYEEQLSDVMIYASCADPEKIRKSIDDLYNEYLSRIETSKSRKRVLNTPKLLIINSFSCLEEYEKVEEKEVSDDVLTADIDDLMKGIQTASFDDSDSLLKKVITLYKSGYEQNIYVVLHDRQAKDFEEAGHFIDFSRVVCCDSKEIDQCLTSTGGTHSSFFNVPDSYAVLFPNVSKVRPYIFSSSETEEYLTKLKGVILNGK